MSVQAPQLEIRSLFHRFTILGNQVRTFGIVHAIRATVAHVLNPPIRDSFDRRYGVRTSDFIQSTDSDIEGPNREHAQAHGATPEGVGRDVFSSLQIPFEDFTFIDLGSGMGRMVLLASEHPFKKVVGVELSPTYAGICRKNLEAYPRTRKAKDVVILEQDVTTFDFPDEPSVLFMFNPFGMPVLDKALERIQESLKSAPRRVLIVYVHNPFGEDRLRKAGFVVLHETQLLQDYWSWKIWEHESTAGV